MRGFNPLNPLDPREQAFSDTREQFTRLDANRRYMINRYNDIPLHELINVNQSVYHLNNQMENIFNITRNPRNPGNTHIPHNLGNPRIPDFTPQIIPNHPNLQNSYMPTHQPISLANPSHPSSADNHNRFVLSTCQYIL